MAHKILLIDDSSISRKMFKRELPNEGYEILEASSGASGIEIYKNESIDLVFLDLTMPEMDGFQALEILKNIDPQVKVIILSADVQTTSREKAFELGAVDFVNKPINNENLKCVLERELSC